ncbi:MAG TPA: hypothetical protein VFD04_15305 [Actinomycetes bacterium]|nr:hypothetical protein [Actinomycetes bacterium]
MVAAQVDLGPGGRQLPGGLLDAGLLREQAFAARRAAAGEVAGGQVAFPLQLVGEGDEPAGVGGQPGQPVGAAAALDVLGDARGDQQQHHHDRDAEDGHQLRPDRQVLEDRLVPWHLQRSVPAAGVVDGHPYERTGQAGEQTVREARRRLPPAVPSIPMS